MTPADRIARALADAGLFPPDFGEAERVHQRGLTDRLTAAGRYLMRWADALPADCPACGARAGAVCVTRFGWDAEEPHAAREQVK